MSSTAVAIPPSMQKQHAAALLIERLGSRANPWIGADANAAIEQYLAAHAPLYNACVKVATSSACGVEITEHAAGSERHFKPPIALTPPPAYLDWKTPAVRRHQASAKMASLPMGYICSVSDAPAIFDKEFHLIEDYSSYYSKLIFFYEHDIGRPQKPDRYIDGRLLVLLDDVGGSNYCHWLCDWLPRLALANDASEDLYVAVSPLRAGFQKESLEIIGRLSDRQIVEVQPWECVQARELIVPSNLNDIRHPSFSGSPWAPDFLRARCGIVDEPGHRKIYISRRDASQRRVLGEDRLVAALERYGYDTIVLSGMPFIEQARLFGSASHVVGLHGAGLTNILFTPSSSRLLEIIPRTYGTPAFWILASTRGIDYALYVSENISPGNITQGDDIEIDVEDFLNRCADFIA